MALMLGTYTSAEFLQLPEGFPAQLVEGHLVREPAPAFGHQRIAGDIHAVARALVGHRRAAMAPVDILIDALNAYQPDVVVFRDPIDDDTAPSDLPCPLLVVEVLSPSTAERDRAVKRLRYLEAGIEEVWLVDANTQSVDVYDQHRHRHVPRRGAGTRSIESRALKGFELDPSLLFQN